ncbi:MAG: AEC family transporter [Propionibacteriaceae bacterium]|nr:AEC family transporter [Propionibacteriaceae bacterium]
MGFDVAASQVLVMFIIIAAGWLVFRAKLVGKKAVTGMTNVLIYIVNPCLILDAFQFEFDAERLGHFGIAFGLNLATMLLIIPLSRLAYPKKLIRDDADRRSLRFGTIYTNVGFYGLPLARALLGEDGVFYMIAFILAFAVVVWTQGVAMYVTDADFKTKALKIVKNPNIIATVVAVPLYLLGLLLPPVLGQAVGLVTELNTPLSMIVIGCNLAVIPLRSILIDKLAWYGTLITNLAVPAFFLGLLTLLPFVPNDIRLIALIGAACPVPAFLVMFSVIYRVNTAFPTRFLCLSTLTSVLTLPSLVALAGVIW